LPFTAFDVLRLIKPDSSDAATRMYGVMDRTYNRLVNVAGPARPAVNWVRGRLRSSGLTHERRCKQAILSYLSPELLRIERGETDRVTDPRRHLSERLRGKCLEEFKASWYYANVVLPLCPGYDLGVPEYIHEYDWWGTYAKASICEYLVRNGVEITV
jgi:hypothetical protein